MKGDIPDVALRLAQQLPSRRHEWQDPLVAPTADRPYRRRPIRIGGVTYTSATEAARKLRHSTRRIYEWLRNGEAEYVE